MAGAAKRRANAERHHNNSSTNHSSTHKGSDSGDTTDSGKASHSVASNARTARSGRSHQSTYDGNRDPGSPRGSPRSSPRGSPNLESERNPATARPIVTNKNLDVGTAGFAILRGDEVPQGLAKRPAPSKLGTSIKIGLNTFHVEALPSTSVYQYDVIIGSGTEKRGLVKKVFQSKAVQKLLGGGFIYDGNKLAWSTKNLDRGEAKVMVDLDSPEEGGKPKKSGKENKHRFVIKKTNRVRLDTLMAYLEGRIDFDNAVLESINFLDHMLREWPSLQYTSIKRSFFARGEQRFDLGSGVEAFKGCFASMRIVHGGVGQSARLSINVDVANGTFWTESLLHNAAVKLTGRRDPNDLAMALKQGESSFAGKALKKMRKLHVTAQHRRGEKDQYVIERFVYTSARDAKFEKDGKTVSIYDYFAKEFGVRLQHPDLPLVKATKGKNTLLPMEVLKIDQNQRYASKMDERQTSNMIKFAVEPPTGRWNAIQHGLKMLSWDQDPVLKSYGVKVNKNMTMVDARLIPAPKVQFGVGTATPGTSGRWDLKGKKFLSANQTALKSWAICVIPGRRGGKPDRGAVQNFIAEFCKIYGMHGGKVENKSPAFQLANGDDVGAWVTATWNAAGNQSNSRPQILVFILPDKDATTYGRIKRSAECRYGVVSQCMQYSHVQKCQGQYISNVCMKFNAKLGGQTARAVGSKSGGPTGIFSTPTAIIGADVSHAAPGMEAASMAAMTLSMDKLGIRYAAACETNGYRVEMISTDNITSMLKPLLQQWSQSVGQGSFPKRLLYLRDGVSEGQYQHVLQQEVADMKALLRSAGQNIPFLVVVGGKRHHVRFFPEKGKGDRNDNALPGTLVETGVTSARDNDFFLCSHAAIKGTARPMHYHVLLNEPGMPNEEIQTLLYEQCYQYIKSSTPISQHPAIYYAHLASNRAIPHDPAWAGSSDGTQSVASKPHGSQAGKTGSSSGAPTEFPKLMPMPNQGGIVSGMWYI